MTRQKAVIFDFDGVICDSMPLHNAIHHKILQRYHKDMSDDELQRFNGVPAQDIFKSILGPDCDVPALLHERDTILLRDAPAAIKPIDGIHELLERLKGTPKAIGSSSSRQFIELCLRALKLDHHFTHIVGIDDVRKGKPDPEIYLKAAQLLHIDPKHCIVIEDGIQGMHAAKNAGMYCIGLVQDTTQQYPADELVTSLRDVKINQQQ